MSRFLDERGRIFGKVSVVDVVVLLVIVAVVVFAVMRLTGTATEKVPVTATFTVEQVRVSTRDAIVAQLDKKGAVSNDGGTVLGQIKDVTSKKARLEYFNPLNDPEAAPVVVRDSEIFWDISVTVQGQGSVSGQNVTIGGVRLAVGKKVTLVGPGYEVLSTVTGVTY